MSPLEYQKLKYDLHTGTNGSTCTLDINLNKHEDKMWQTSLNDNFKKSEIANYITQEWMNLKQKN